MTDKRNPWYTSDMDEFRARIDSFIEEGGGFARLCLVRKDDNTITELMMQGDPEAVAIGQTIGEAYNRMNKGIASLCLCCLSDLAKARTIPMAYVVLLPGSHGRDKRVPKVTMAAPVCAACCEKTSDNGIAHDATALLHELFEEVEVLDDEWRTDA